MEPIDNINVCSTEETGKSEADASVLQKNLRNVSSSLLIAALLPILVCTHDMS